MSLLIAIVTCSKFAERANTVRRTWAKNPPSGVTIKFFRGNPIPSPSLIEPDEVYLDVDDGYAGLPQKVQGAIAWAYENGFEYVFKTDDDCFVNLPILVRLPFGRYDYFGRFRGPSGGYPADYASGFGYFLSRKAMKEVVHGGITQDWAEDRWVGNLLASKGIYGYTQGSDTFAPCSPPVLPSQVWRSNIRNAAVFCEFETTAALEQMWTGLCNTHTSYCSQPPQPAPIHHVSEGDRNKPPTDSMFINPKVGGRRTAVQADNTCTRPVPPSDADNFAKLRAAAQAKGAALTAVERHEILYGKQDKQIQLKECPCCGGTGRVIAR